MLLLSMQESWCNARMRAGRDYSAAGIFMKKRESHALSMQQSHR